MKKLVLVLCALFFVSSIQAQVWVPIGDDLLNLESFRHQATQSIEDDLDNGIDGTDIFAVEGARIYTNLSNLATGMEQQGNNFYSANTVVIGATSSIYKGYKVTAFYGNQNTTQTSGGESTAINEWDSDANDVFDRLSSRYNIQSLGVQSPANTMLLNIGKDMGKGTKAAFTYRRTSGEYRREFEDSTYFIDTDLTDNDIMELWREVDNGDSTSAAGLNLYSLSYFKPYRNWDLRGDVFLMRGGEKINSEELEFYFEDRDPEDLLTTDTYLDSTLMDNKNDYNASLLGINLRISDENKHGIYWELGGSYGMIFGSGDYQRLTREHMVDNNMIGTDVAVYDDVSIDNTLAPISVSGSAMGINGRMEWQISENVIFGLGLMANSFSMNLEYDEDVSSLDVVDYDDGDTEANDTDDYVTTSVSGQTRVRTVKTSYNRIVIPAGVEVNFGKNKDWYMRLGALSTGSKSEITSIIDVTSVQRDSTITVLGDGSSTIVVDNAINYSDLENTNSGTYQNVDYFYGIGWKPSKNLSLDLLGMFDASGVELLSTDWLRSLKLSATINVY